MDSRTTQTSPKNTHRSTQTLVSQGGPLRMVVKLLGSMWLFTWLAALLEYVCGLVLGLLDFVNVGGPASVPASEPVQCTQTSPGGPRIREGRKRRSNVERLLGRVLPVGLQRALLGVPDTASFGSLARHRQDVGQSHNKFDGKGSKHKQGDLQVSDSEGSVDGGLPNTGAFEDYDLLPCVQEELESVAEGAASTTNLDESESSTVVQEGDSETKDGVSSDESKIDANEEEDIDTSEETCSAANTTQALAVLVGGDLLLEENSFEDPSYVLSSTGTLDSAEFVESEEENEEVHDKPQVSDAMTVPGSEPKPEPDDK